MAQSHDALLYQAGWITADELFRRMFSAYALDLVFRERFKSSSAKGIDRINGFQFSGRSSAELEIVSAKCLTSKFRFAPFLEKLKLKGRGKSPRVISIPIVRDRVVLHQLQKYLAIVFPEQVPRNVASTYIREVAEDISAMDRSLTWVCSTDIKTFYDSIDQRRMIALLGRQIKSHQVLSLVAHAMQTPTVPKNTPRAKHAQYKQGIGVPQGLSISNILAAIYMADVDKSMKGFPGLHYYRYVDDVLMYGEKNIVSNAFASVKRRLARRGLQLHGLSSDKTKFGSLNENFSYLGYIFELPLITVRSATVERFLQSIAAKISDFKHNRSKRLEKLKYLDEARLTQIFYLELNEKITGAISQKKRYGWIAYFNEITDEKLLHKMDRAILGMLTRVPELVNPGAPGLKKLSKSYFEMKFNPQGGYVRDYDAVTTTAQKLSFLAARGRVDPAFPLTDVQINERYEHYVRMSLARMHEDEGEIY